MDQNEFITSGILELYVFGKTTEAENEQVSEMARQHEAVRDEILSIEKAVASLSESMAPQLSASLYAEIREAVLPKAQHRKQRSGANWSAVLGWAAAIVFLAAVGFLYTLLVAAEDERAVAERDKTELKTVADSLKQQKFKAEELLAMLRDENNAVVPLNGQPIAPDARAKVYWNKQTNAVYLDAGGLPEPPEGSQYQVWSLVLTPSLTPTSIGMLNDFSKNDSKLFALEQTSNAEAFGITLEPNGGSASPTLDQLYTMGTVTQ